MMASRRANPLAFDAGRCLVAAGIVFCIGATTRFLPQIGAGVFWGAPILSGAVVAYRAHRPAAPAALGAVLGLLTCEAVCLALEDAVLEDGPGWVALAFLVAAFWFLAGGAAKVASRLAPPVGVPPGHCEDCGYDLTGNVSGRCPECGSTVVRQYGGDSGAES